MAKGLSFKHRDPERVFAVIAAGEANASTSDDPARAALECFPPALRGLTVQGAPDPDAYPEPLAPDWRKDGFARLRARLVAAMLRVDFDDLWKRDRRRARRRARRTAVGVIASSVVLLSVFWWIDLVNWKSGFAGSTVEAIAQARELAMRMRSAQSESLGTILQPAVSHDGAKMLAMISRGSDVHLAVWDVASVTLRTRLTKADAIVAVFDASGERIVAAEDDWVVRTRDAVKLSELAETRLEGAETRMWAAAFDAGMRSSRSRAAAKSACGR